MSKPTIQKLITQWIRKKCGNRSRDDNTELHAKKNVNFSMIVDSY